MLLGCVGSWLQLLHRVWIYRVWTYHVDNQSHSLPGKVSLVRMHAVWLCPVDSCLLFWLFSVWPLHSVVVALCDCVGAPRAG